MLKLKFGKDFEAEFWCYLKTVTLVEDFKTFGNVLIYWLLWVVSTQSDGNTVYPPPTVEVPLIQTLNPQTTSTVSRGTWLGCLVLSSHAKQYQPHLTPGFPVRVQVQRNQYWCHLLSFFCNNITSQCIIGEFFSRKKSNNTLHVGLHVINF